MDEHFTVRGNPFSGTSFVPVARVHWRCHQHEDDRTFHPLTSTATPDTASPRSTVERLAERLDANWLHLERARELAQAKRQELNHRLASHDAEDTTIVVFGSLARYEFTAGSDIDWTLLVDGSADPHHQDVAHEIAWHVREVEGRPPRP